MKSRAFVLCALIAAGICSLGAINVHGQLCFQLTDEPYHEDFNNMITSGTGNQSSVPIGFAYAETGGAANITITADDGSSATGDTYSYGGGPNDRALGELTANNLQSTCGACFVNATGHNLTSFAISYTGEQWRLGADDGNVDRLDFQFSTDTTSLLDPAGTWTNINSLDFESPHIAGTAGPLAGNAAGNRTVFPAVIIPFVVNIPRGGIFFIRWVPTNIPGEDDGLAIDDFTILIPRVKFTSFSAAPGAGQRQIAIQGVAQPFGVSVQLERSPNLQSWSPISSTTSNAADGTFSFNTTEPLSTTLQFYHAEEL